MNFPLLLLTFGGLFALGSQFARTAQNLRAIVTGVRFNAAEALRGQAIINIITEVTNPTQLPVNLQAISGVITTAAGNNIATADLFEPINLPGLAKRSITIPLRFRAGFIADIIRNKAALSNLNLKLIFTTSLGQTEINTALDAKQFLP